MGLNMYHITPQAAGVTTTCPPINVHVFHDCRLWHLEYGTEIGCIKKLGGKSHGDAQLLCMCVHPDNRQLVVGTFHERAYLLRVAEVQRLTWDAIAHVAEKVHWAPEAKLITIHQYEGQSDEEDISLLLNEGKEGTKIKDVFWLKYRQWLEWEEKMEAGEAEGHMLPVDAPPRLGQIIVPKIQVWLTEEPN